MLTVGQDLDPTGGNRSSEASVLFDNMVLWPVMRRHFFMLSILPTEKHVDLPIFCIRSDSFSQHDRFQQIYRSVYADTFWVFLLH